MRPHRLRIIATVALALGAFLLVIFALSDRLTAQCHADDGYPRVHVDDAISNATRITTRITNQLRDGDEIKVWVEPDTIADDPHWVNPDGSIWLWAHGKQLRVYGNYWMPQQVLDDQLYRVSNVNRTAVDQIIGMIAQIHTWQADNPKPPPPPPPPPPPGPPPPPPGPTIWDFHWWNWSWGWAPVTAGVLFVLWLPLEIRRRRRVAEYARRADEQADWGADEYGIKSTLD